MGRKFAGEGGFYIYLGKENIAPSDVRIILIKMSNFQNLNLKNYQDLWIQSAPKCVGYRIVVVIVQSPSRVRFFVTPWTAARQASLSITSPGVCPSSCLLHRSCHPTISPSVALFSFCLQSYPTSGAFPMSQLFASGGQSRYRIVPTQIIFVGLLGP